MRCSSTQRSAVDSPFSTRSSSVCASSSWPRARSWSISRASTASSTSAIARSCSTLKKPGPVAYSLISSPTCTRVVLALEDLGEALDRVLELHVLARSAGELLGDEVRLRQEALDLPRTRHDQPVLVRQLLDPEDRDDVLQFLVALQHLLNPRRDLVVLLR